MNTSFHVSSSILNIIFLFRVLYWLFILNWVTRVMLRTTDSWYTVLWDDALKIDIPISCLERLQDVIWAVILSIISLSYCGQFYRNSLSLFCSRGIMPALRISVFLKQSYYLRPRCIPVIWSPTTLMSNLVKLMEVFSFHISKVMEEDLKQPPIIIILIAWDYMPCYVPSRLYVYLRKVENRQRQDS